MNMAIGVSIVIILYLAFFLSFAEDMSDISYTLLMPLCVMAVIAALGGLILFVSWLF